ncbi:barstar family protein [Pantoea sp. ARC607]|uniref:barstar family protein n=1 Tax=unclassified Pantoea TaxID=2630326 RepID=UPI000DA79587|nr:barstar family protein [Pantoea sp. ARC607]PZL90225.1 Barstar, RNAse (barnase) inhibitor [Pantoea sp. ARC607]
MLSLTFDLRQLTTRAAFYQQFAEQSGCPETFGHNLDALWDWLTGGMALPATLRLQHADAQQPDLAPVLALLEEAAQSLEGELRLIID